MTLQENIRLILRKYPQARHRRGEFAWYYGLEFNEFKFFATELQFKAFFQKWESVSRAYREILKEEEFRLSPEENSKRYQKASNFQKIYAKP